MPDPSRLHIERSLWQSGFTHVAGLDEAGRGCLAGPVVAAAVILPRDVLIEGVDDSKALTAEARDVCFERIRRRAVAYAVGFCTPAEIDDLNILWAALEAMRRAAAALDPPADYLLVDGNRCFPDSPWPVRTVVKGDSRSHTIAAASILAKVTRDRFMVALHEEFPEYGWDRHKGYPTVRHYEALAAHGPSPYHRRSFRLTR